MRYFFVILLVIGVGAASLVLFLSRQSSGTGIRIGLSSAPFPMSVGSTTLLVTLTGADGAPIEGAKIYVEANVGHAGMLPMTGRSSEMVNGQYPVRLTWANSGDWLVNVTAVLADDKTAVGEQFPVFVYSIPPAYYNPAAYYPSVSETAVEVTANADREKWMVIALGTQELLREGHGEDTGDILLKVGGQDTLVIRNNDITDHTIGPFFVRSGETLRQRFTEPAVFVGVCSISDAGTISIIVEG